MNNRIEFIDNTRSLACIMVVALHTAAPHLYSFGHINHYEWFFANIIDSFSRCCVPLFFMISGYFFLGAASPKKRHFLKIASSLTFYSILFILYRISKGDLISAKEFLLIIIQPAFYHLWFFYSIFTLYLIMATVKVRNLGIKGIAVISISMVCLNPSLFTIPIVFDRTYSISGPGFFDGSIIYYLGYACIGAGFYKMGTESQKPYHRILYLITYLLSSTAITAATFLISAKSQSFDNTFYEYTNSLVIIQSISLFGAIQNSRKIPSAFGKISKLSLPIYGLHALFLDLLQRLRLDLTSFLEIPIYFFVSLISAIATASLISAIDRRGLLH